MELNINSISKQYSNDVKALDSVNLTVSKGMFGLLGPNGAGKSSLMRTLATLQKPDSGEVMFDRENIFSAPHLFRAKLGYLPQEFGVYPNASAIELLDYFAQLKGVHDSKKRKSEVNYLLELVNLSDHKNRNVDTFSGGMRQRFGIAQTLIADPEVIIVDEPTAGLDPAERNRFYNILHTLGDDAIVILSTHIVADVTHLCSEMAILHEGQIKAKGKPSNLIDQVRGQLWQKSISPDELNLYREQYNVIATRLHQGQIQVVVQSSQELGDGFIIKAADLEDVYFTHVPESII